jgi:hypothetical protein
MLRTRLGIAILVAACFWAAITGGANSQDRQGTVKKLFSSETALQRRIQQRLGEPISLNLQNVPLERACADLSVVSGVSIVLDPVALKHAKINSNTPVSLAVENIDLKTALTLLLNRLSLCFVIERGGIKITPCANVDSGQRKPITRETAIRQRLRKPISLNLQDIPLDQACTHLSVLSGVNIWLDTVAFEKANFNRRASVSLVVENVELKSAMSLLLNRRALRVVVTQDGIVISPQRGATPDPKR